MSVDLKKLRFLVREILEDAENLDERGPLDPSAHGLLNVGPQQQKKSPPPLPNQKQAAPSLPQGNALGKFKADVGMAFDAANRAKQIIDAGQGNTKEALRWIDKLIGFANSAKQSLGGK